MPADVTFGGEIVWSEYRSPEPDVFAYEARVTSKGIKFTVKITTEVDDDKGRDACLAKAVEKIRRAEAAGTLSKDSVIIVENPDFPR